MFKNRKNLMTSSIMPKRCLNDILAEISFLLKLLVHILDFVDFKQIVDLEPVLSHRESRISNFSLYYLSFT